MITVAADTIIAVAYLQSDEMYRGQSITVLSAADISGIISDTFQSSGAQVSGMESVPTAFGAVKAYRTTCTATVSGMPCDAVVYTYISGNTLTMVALFCVDNSDGILQTVANNVSVGGSTVSPKL